jgi:hypothetical protein
MRRRGENLRSLDGSLPERIRAGGQERGFAGGDRGGCRLSATRARGWRGTGRLFLGEKVGPYGCI